MDDPVTRLERAMSATGRVFRGVRPDQHALSTPCPAWDVANLMNHIVAGNRYFAARARGQQPDMAIWKADHIGAADPVQVFDESADDALRAWRTPGATDRRATLPSGGQGPRAFDIHLLDVFVHGWDLATATGQDRSLDAESAQALYDTWYGKVPDQLRETTTVFGPAVECPPEASVADRLAAYLGRAVA